MLFAIDLALSYELNCGFLNWLIDLIGGANRAALTMTSQPWADR